MHRASLRRGHRGFTLIELLIVVAIIGIIAAILIPNLIDALQKSKQKRTVGDMRTIGTCWMSWLTDAVSAGAAGTTTRTYDLTQLSTSLTAQQLLQTLYRSPTFFYCQEVPASDAWGFAYEFRYSGNPLLASVMAIRSPGRDGAFSGDSYPITPFLTTDYDQDIVWADGLFVHYPAGELAVTNSAP